MSKFAKLVEEVKLEYATDTLNEGIGSIARNALLGAGLTLGGMQGANALTDVDALYNNPQSEIITKYEHGGQGYSAIIKDNYGGYSYGKEQLSTRRNPENKPNSTFDKFLEYLESHDIADYNKLNKAGGWEAAFNGTEKFKKIWKELANDKKFQNIYDNFITDTQIIPVYKRMDQATSTNLDKVTTWGSQNNAIKAAIRSVIIQHGREGAFNLIKKVIRRTNPQTEEDFLKNLYTARSNKFPAYKTRYTNEYNDLKDLV